MRYLPQKLLTDERGEPERAVCLKADKKKDWRMGGGAEEEKRTDMTNGEEGNQLVRTNFHRLEYFRI